MYPIRFVLVVLAFGLTLAAALTPRVPLWVAVLVLCLAALTP
jgi:hypothetical protein